MSAIGYGKWKTASTSPSGGFHTVGVIADPSLLDERLRILDADKHSISIHTVISHRKNITRKTGIKSVAGLTVYALLNNMIGQSDME